MTGLGPDARAVRAALSDAHALCSALGLLAGGKRVPGGVVIRCPNPAHSDRTPSCSVRRGPDGTLAARCFSCGWSGDALTLVAVARGLNLQTDFPDVVELAADIAGGLFTTNKGPVRAVAPPPSYPPAAQVEALWSACLPLERDDAAGAYLAGRAIDPGMVDLYDLARVLPADARCPSWAHIRGHSWIQAGYRLVVPMVDYLGVVRSVRGWRLPGEGLDVGNGDALPKRLAPAKHSTVGLVMACPVARHMLATGAAGSMRDIVIAEGEPDWLTWAASVSDANDTPPAVLGVVSAAWSDAIATRIPEGSRVFIRTHRDDAGDRYSRAIQDSLNDYLIAVFDFPRGAKGTDGEAA